MQGDMGTILTVLGFFLLLYGAISYGGQIFGKLTGTQDSIFIGAVTAPTTTTSDAALAARLWTAIGQPGAPGVRFIKKNIVTVTGTVVGKTPHYNTDGDMVFGLMPDPQFKNLLTPGNITHIIDGGGIWCEAVCQRPNISIEPVHAGDCVRGGPFPKFPMPKIGEKWSVTGLHIIDVREGNFSEIHPITRMSKI